MQASYRTCWLISISASQYKHQFRKWGWFKYGRAGRGESDCFSTSHRDTSQPSVTPETKAPKRATGPIDPPSLKRRRRPDANITVQSRGAEDTNSGTVIWDPALSELLRGSPPSTENTPALGAVFASAPLEWEATISTYTFEDHRRVPHAITNSSVDANAPPNVPVDADSELEIDNIRFGADFLYDEQAVQSSTSSVHYETLAADDMSPDSYQTEFDTIFTPTLASSARSSVLSFFSSDRLCMQSFSSSVIIKRLNCELARRA